MSVYAPPSPSSSPTPSQWTVSPESLCYVGVRTANDADKRNTVDEAFLCARRAFSMPTMTMTTTTTTTTTCRRVCVRIIQFLACARTHNCSPAFNRSVYVSVCVRACLRVLAVHCECVHFGRHIARNQCFVRLLDGCVWRCVLSVLCTETIRSLIGFAEANFFYSGVQCRRQRIARLKRKKTRIKRQTQEKNFRFFLNSSFESIFRFL